MNDKNIYKRLYKVYTKLYLKKIIFAAFFSIIIAVSTSAIAWLLDPAIKKLFIEKDQSLIFIIPLAIILAFSIKGISLYLAKTMMISMGKEDKKKLQFDMIKSLINADLQVIHKKHSGKFISNLNYDVNISKGIKSTLKDIDPETGKISWDIEYVPAFDSVFKEFDSLRKIMAKLDIKVNDPIIDDIALNIKKEFNRYRTYIRKNYPEIYKGFTTNEEIDEMSTTGATVGFSPKYFVKKVIIILRMPYN